MRAETLAERLRRRPLLAAWDADAVLVWQTRAPADDHGRTACFELSPLPLAWRVAREPDPRGARLLAVTLRRQGFEALLLQAVHAAFERAVYGSRRAWHLATRYANVTVAWHPDVDATGAALSHEAPRFTVRDFALQRFEHDVLGVEDWTDRLARPREASDALPPSAPYPWPEEAHALLAGAAPERTV